MGWANRERESWETEYFAVVGNVLRNVQLLHSGAGCTIVWSPQRPVMIAATCQVAETTGASHYLPSSAPSRSLTFAQFVKIQTVLPALSLFPNVLFVGSWRLIYKRADLPDVADEQLMGSNSS